MSRTPLRVLNYRWWFMWPLQQHFQRVTPSKLKSMGTRINCLRVKSYVFACCDNYPFCSFVLFTNFILKKYSILTARGWRRRRSSIFGSAFQELWWTSPSGTYGSLERRPVRLLRRWCESSFFVVQSLLHSNRHGTSDESPSTHLVGESRSFE